MLSSTDVPVADLGFPWVAREFDCACEHTLDPFRAGGWKEPVAGVTSGGNYFLIGRKKPRQHQRDGESTMTEALWPVSRGFPSLMFDAIPSGGQIQSGKSC